MTSKWSSNANEATCLRLVGAPPPADGVFHPAFTYSIFGEAETIFGYTDLHIRLAFASGSLVPALDVDYASKNTTTAAQVDDVYETLAEYLPRDELVPLDALEQQATADAAGGAGAFQPLGERIATYTRTAVKPKGRASLSSLFSARGRPAEARPREFHIYKATWDTPGFRAWHARVQILTLFFIEGASYIQEDEPNWEFYTVFERVAGEKGDAFHFVGYTSLYRFWRWPGTTRLRLSQFLILPPYQKQRHGAELYETVYAQALADEAVCELTVEDPSEAFDQLRDTCDLRRLARPGGPLADADLLSPFDKEWSTQARTASKMAPRQWARMLEMLALMRLEHAEPAQLHAYRLQVKSRIYAVNRDVLVELPRTQRLAKLHETFASVMEEYAEITGADIPEALLEYEVAEDAPPKRTSLFHPDTEERAPKVARSE